MRSMKSKKKALLRKIASGITFWGGLAVIGVIALPTAILAGLIALIWKGTDILVKKIDNK